MNQVVRFHVMRLLMKPRYQEYSVFILNFMKDALFLKGQVILPGSILN